MAIRYRFRLRDPITNAVTYESDPFTTLEGRQLSIRQFTRDGWHRIERFEESTSEGADARIRTRPKTSAGFRNRFGPEYDRAGLGHGSGHKAETKLADREARVEGLKIRAHTAAERGRFSADWQSVQSRFVDHQKSAVAEADKLVSSLMQS